MASKIIVMKIAKIIIHYFYRIQFMSLKEEWQQLGPNQRIYHYEKIRPRT